MRLFIISIFCILLVGCAKTVYITKVDYKKSTIHKVYCVDRYDKTYTLETQLVDNKGNKVAVGNTVKIKGNNIIKKIK